VGRGRLVASCNEAESESPFAEEIEIDTVLISGLSKLDSKVAKRPSGRSVQGRTAARALSFGSWGKVTRAQALGGGGSDAGGSELGG